MEFLKEIKKISQKEPVEFWIEIEEGFELEKRDRKDFLEEKYKDQNISIRYLNEDGKAGLSYSTSFNFLDLEEAVLKAKALSKYGVPSIFPKKEEKYPEIYYQGFLHQTEKEVIEALTTLKIIKEQDIPEIDSFDPISYLHGISESVGEVRRHLLDKMREGKKCDFENYLKIMDEIYYFLLNFPYNDAITRSLRRQVDYVRTIIEKTRGEITTYYLFKKKDI